MELVFLLIIIVFAVWAVRWLVIWRETELEAANLQRRYREAEEREDYAELGRVVVEAIDLEVYGPTKYRRKQ